MPMTALTILLAAVLAMSSAAPVAERRSGTSTSAAPEAVGHLALSDDGNLTLSPESGPIRIPIDLRFNLIYLRGRLDDSDSLWMVLDSGASVNAIDTGVAKRLGLEVASRGQGRGAGGLVEAGQIRSVTVRLPGVTLEGAPIAAMPLDPFERRTGRAIEAIIGYPLLSRCVVKIDYAARMLELVPAASFEYAGTGAVLPLTFHNRHPYITARVTLPGRRPIGGWFVIDLGSAQALILSPGFIRDERLQNAFPKTIEARSRGVGGQIPSRMARVERLEIGGMRFDRTVTMLPIPGDTWISAPGMLGNIGGEILRRFTVIFDYSRKRMILEPNPAFGDAFEADMSGLATRMGPDGSGALKVEWIQSDSPAAAAGVRPNDLIERIDGRPALEIGVPGLRELSRRAGETHRLLIRRGDKRIEIALKTRRQI